MAKTKDILIDVARRLFAEKGMENTTMNDIANESGKGRRTLYTYFNSKEDIYLTIIEKELQYLYEKLFEIEKMDIAPDEKLKSYIFVRLNTFKEIISRNGTIQASFFQNATEVEKVRRPIEKKELRILKKIFSDGIEQGVFRLQNAQWAAEITLNMLKGLEKPYYKKRFYQQMQQRKDFFIDALFNGFVIRKD
ncbi:MAG: TetR/AcrR family transcriptional regulator [Paludibacteraceae bacterium]|nr:TetR/AcrR family transcriptional regulator [Paludibacteraceae bacterium]